MTTKETNINIDKLIIKMTHDFVEEECSENKNINNIKLLLNLLKNEAKYIDSKEIKNNLAIVSQLLNQNYVFGQKTSYVVHRGIFATLMEEYIRIIDAK